MDEKLPPFFQLSGSDHGGFAVVVALCTIVVSSTVSAIRCVVATRQRVGFQLDDATFYIACFLGNASSICIYRAVLVGLGKRIETLSPQSLDSYYKLVYSAQLISILSMTSAKVSVVLLIKRITQIDNQSWNCTLVFVWAWGIFSFLAMAFQCQVPKPWIFVPAQCKTHGYLQYPVIVLNIITDAILGTGMLPTIWKLNIARDTRVTVMTLFGIRLVVSGIGIGELVSVIRSVGEVDQTWVNLPRSIWLMLVTHTSIITATIPRTHSFWASLQSGKAGIQITEQEYELSGGSSQPSALGSGTSSRNPFSKFSKRKKNDSDDIQTTSWSTFRNRELGRSRSKTQSRMAEERLRRQTSEEPLQLVPRTNSDLNTRVYCDEVTNEASAGRSDDDTGQTSLRHSSQGGVWMEREVVMEVEYLVEP